MGWSRYLWLEVVVVVVVVEVERWRQPAARFSLSKKMVSEPSPWPDLEFEPLWLRLPGRSHLSFRRRVVEVPDIEPLPAFSQIENSRVTEFTLVLYLHDLCNFTICDWMGFGP